MRSRYGLGAYVAGAAFARVADELAGPALLLTALAVTGSQRTASFCLGALTVAAAVGGPPLGAALDRSARPHRLLAAAVGLFGAGLLLLAVAVARLPVVLVLVLAFVVGLAGPAVTGSWTGQLGRLVPAERLSRAFGLDAATYGLAALAGPGLAGLAALADRPAFGLVLAGGPFLAVAAVSAARLRPGPGDDPVGTRPVPLSQTVLEGLRALAATSRLRTITVTSSLSAMGVAMVLVSAPRFGIRWFGEPGAGAVLLTADAATALLVSVVLARRALPGSGTARFAASTTLLGVAIAGLALAPNVAWALVMLAGLGAASSPQIIAIFDERHASAPPGLTTQVFTTSASIKISMTALGAAGAGWLADRPVAVTLAVAAGLQVAAVAVQVLPWSGRRSN